MTNIVPFPNSTAEADPITALRKAIHRCKQERGEKTAALVCAKEFEIPNPFDWRSPARKMFSSKGDK